jgi:hypothetical protein
MSTTSNYNPNFLYLSMSSFHNFFAFILLDIFFRNNFNNKIKIKNRNLFFVMSYNQKLKTEN